MHNVILIERYLPSSIFWPNLIKTKKLNELSLEELLNKYQGFEGELIAFFSIKEPESELNKIINECLEVKNSNNYLMFHIISDSKEPYSFLKEHAIQMGYDVGVCDEEKTIFSSIFNEILFGNLNELISYKDLLNDNLLFSDRSLAEKYVSLHDTLSEEGKGVEDYEKMIVYEIWKQKN